MFAACPVPSVPALVAPQRPKRRSQYPFGNSCNDIRRQKSVLRRPSSVLCRISNHPRSSSDPPQFNKPRYVGPVGTTNEYMIGTDDAPSSACYSSGRSQSVDSCIHCGSTSHPARDATSVVRGRSSRSGLTSLKSRGQEKKRGPERSGPCSSLTGNLAVSTAPK